MTSALYGIEIFGTRQQFKTMTRTWPNGIGRGENTANFSTTSYDNVQGTGSKLYFESLYSDRPHYCEILAIGSFKSCMVELNFALALSIDPRRLFGSS
jgi:hypothetical protein